MCWQERSRVCVPQLVIYNRPPRQVSFVSYLRACSSARFLGFMTLPLLDPRSRVRPRAALKLRFAKGGVAKVSSSRSSGSSEFQWRPGAARCTAVQIQAPCHHMRQQQEQHRDARLLLFATARHAKLNRNRCYCVKSGGAAGNLRAGCGALHFLRNKSQKSPFGLGGVLRPVLPGIGLRQKTLIC